MIFLFTIPIAIIAGSFLITYLAKSKLETHFQLQLHKVKLFNSIPMALINIAILLSAISIQLFFKFNSFQIMLSYALAIFCFLAIKDYTIRKNLRKFKYPEFFQKLFLIEIVVRNIGIILLIVVDYLVRF